MEYCCLLLQKCKIIHDIGVLPVDLLYCCSCCCLWSVINLQKMSCRQVLGKNLCWRQKSTGLPSRWWMLIVNLKWVRMRIKNGYEGGDQLERTRTWMRTRSWTLRGTEEEKTRRTGTRTRKNRGIRRGKEVWHQWRGARTMKKEELGRRKTVLKVWDGEAGLVYESQLQAWEEYPAKTSKCVEIIPSQNHNTSVEIIPSQYQQTSVEIIPCQNQ